MRCALLRTRGVSQGSYDIELVVGVHSIKLKRIAALLAPCRMGPRRIRKGLQSNYHSGLASLVT